MGRVKAWAWYRTGGEKGCYVSVIWKQVRKIKEQQESNGWMRNQMLRWASGEKFELHKGTGFKNSENLKKSSETGNRSIYLDSKWIVHSTFTFAFPNSSMFDTVILKNTFIFLYNLIGTGSLSITCSRKYLSFSMRWKPSIVMSLKCLFPTWNPPPLPPAVIWRLSSFIFSPKYVPNTQQKK